MPQSTRLDRDSRNAAAGRGQRTSPALESLMNEALSGAPIRFATFVLRYPLSRLLHSAAQLLLHPVITLPVLVYLLGAGASQIIWYAIVAGVATGVAAAPGALVAVAPASSRIVIVVLLVVQAAGFILCGAMALGSDTFSNDTVLRLGSGAYLLLVVPTAMLARISEQTHEFRRSTAASLGGVAPALTGSLLAGLLVWRMFDSSGMGPGDLLARIMLAGALFAAAAAWLSLYPTLLAIQLPHPARPMPQIRSPQLLGNRALVRYSVFQILRGLSRFADPFLLVGVLTIIEPDVIWIGGAVLAFAIGDGIARMLGTNAYDNFNVRTIFTISGFLHTVAFIVVAFAADVLTSSVVAERDPSNAWKHWAVVVAAIALGASYRLAQIGHHAYVRSISSPSTRDLSLTIVGVIMIATAFSPIIAVRILDSQEMTRLLQLGVGASVVSLLMTALIVPTYEAPRRLRGAWSLRR